MDTGALVDEALKRLTASNLVTAVRGVRLAESHGVETVLVTVSSDIPLGIRESLAQVLDGLPCDWVEVSPRGVVHGMTGLKDERSWRIGTQAEVDWIQNNTRGGRAITSAIPPVFEAYATVAIPDNDADRRRADSVLVRVLAEESADQPWWLGYLETGAHDVVFDHAPKVTLYSNWSYVLVEAGPQQADTWRDDDPWRGRLPDLIFPADRSWLVSMLWDDDWRCVGGRTTLIGAVLADPLLDSRSVNTEQDATPPGHIAR